MEKTITWPRKILLYLITAVYAFTMVSVGFLHHHDFYGSSGNTPTIQKVVHPNSDGCVACHFIASPELAGGNNVEWVFVEIKYPFSLPVFIENCFIESGKSSFTSRGPPEV